MTMRGRVGFGLALMAVVSAAVATDLPRRWRNWSHFRPISIDDSGEPLQAKELVGIELPETLFEVARSDLSDVRIVDDAGNEVGYAVFANRRGSEVKWRAAEMSDAGFVRGSFTQVVADTGEDGTVHNAVEVTLPEDVGEYFAWVEVAASEDRETWRIVRAKAPLYRFSDRGHRHPVQLRYRRAHDRWVRLRILEAEEEVEVEKLRVAEQVEDASELRRIRRRLARRADSPAGESWWEPIGEMPLVRISGIRVQTARDEFHRPVTVSVSDDGKTWRQIGAGQIYRYRFGEEAKDGSGDSDAEKLRQSLEIEFREAESPLWRVTVLDRGDPAIDDLAVMLVRNPSRVVFRPKAETSYRLVYGNHRAEAPEYELASITTREEQASARPAVVGLEQANDAYVSPDPFTERHPVIMWVALGLAVLVLAGLALRSLR
ncbi:MAG: DUF3999 domain-containing protein [Acidobacteriota bacterium]|nr:DUF3999 domain-containing protein [Acidobacteriota bacterium]